MNRASRLVCVLFAAVLVAACGPENKWAKNNGQNIDPNNGTNANNTTGDNSSTGDNAATNGESNNASTNNTTNNQTSTSTNNQTSTGEITWHKDVRAIVESNCGECHYDGGIGPFALTTYEEVSGLSALIESAVTDGVMPPWPPADDCGTFKYERSLTDADRDKLLQWIANGKPEGNPDDYVAPQDNGSNLQNPDWTTDIGTEYTPNPPDGGVDDYHCFIVEHDFQEDKFMNAFRVRPTNLAAAHHILFWQIDEGQLAEARAKESSPGAGYTCFGSNGVGGETGLIGGWVPGAVPLQFGDGQGMRIPADSFLIVQVHYNTVNNDDPDRTAIDMWFTDGPADTPLGMYPLPDTGLSIPAGDSNAKAGQAVTLPIGATIYGVVPHMHLLGTKIKVTAGNQCLVDIPDWDFNWQGFYLYEDPIDVSAGTRLELECWYDNSTENQPEGRTPEDVSWGEGTYDEMCLNYFITEELPFL